MAWNDNLQGKAYNIASTDAKYLRVMAGPGTGKSYAMKRRVMRLLECGVDPDGILALTFTRVAASGIVAEMKALGVAGCEKIDAGTLHGFCFRLLSRGEVFNFLGRVARPLVTYSSKSVLQFEMSPLLADISPDGGRKGTKRIQLFEAAWAKLQSDAPGWPPADEKVFHDSLISWLTFHEGMLIGEVVPEALRYLRQNPLSPVLSRYVHVLVDEYQDLNRADQSVIDLLSGQNAVIIGDENQSIYRFRYAHPEGILEYNATHPQTVDQDLDECRRCPRKIVELANRLILNNHPGAGTPKLVPLAQNPEGQVHIVQWSSIEEESQGLVLYVRHLLQNRLEPRDILMLVPRRDIANRLRKAFIKAAIAHHSFYQEAALDSDEPQIALCLATLLANPDDRVALRYWLGYGSANWLKGQYAKLRKSCEEDGLSPRQTLENIVHGKLSLSGVGKLVERYTKLCGRLRALQGLKGQSLVDALVPDGNEATDLLRGLMMAAVDAEKTDAAKLVSSIRVAVTQPEPPEEANCVRIMSLQKSKGLTSPVTIVAGCIESFVPTIDPDETPAVQCEILKEQRRLFYVAITRSKERLVVSSFASMPAETVYQTAAKAGGLFGRRHTQPSRFIAELGPTAPQVLSGNVWVKRDFS